MSNATQGTDDVNYDCQLLDDTNHWRRLEENSFFNLKTMDQQVTNSGARIFGADSIVLRQLKTLLKTRDLADNAEFSLSDAFFHVDISLQA